MTQPERGADSREYSVAVPSLFDIFWGKLANGRRCLAEWRKQGFLNKDKFGQTRRRAMRLETLEPRVLLSADLSHSAGIGASLDATLKVEDLAGAPILRLIDNPSSTILGELFLDQDIDVNIHGNDQSDRLKIGFDRAAFAHKIRFNFDGGAGGVDELSGADAASSWQLGADGAGGNDDGTFTGVERVTGGASDDTFFVLDAAASTAVEGGAGSDTLAGADADNAWTVSETDAGTLNALVFGGVENLQGGAGADTFTVTAEGEVTGSVRGGEGSDTLVAADEDNTWVISGADAGTLNDQSFSEVENLTGGAANDTFVFAGGAISGTIDGGGGINTFDYSSRAADVSMNLETGTASDVAAYVNVNRLIGGAGSDTLTGRDADSSWTVTAHNAGTVDGFAFEQVENASGGSGADRFVVSAGLDGTLSGG